MNIIKLLKPAGKWIEQHSAQIFTGIAVVGVPATMALTVKATNQTEERVWKLCHDNRFVDTTVKVKACYKYWIPPAAAAIGTIGCVVAANHVHLKKEAALGAVAALYSGKYEELEKAVREKLGDDKADKIIEEAHKDSQIEAQTTANTFEIWEPYSKQFVKTTTEKLLWAQLIVNQMLKENSEVTLNQFLNLIGGPRCTFGDALGWDDENLILDSAMTGHQWLDIKPYLSNIADKEVMYITYSVNPAPIIA